MPNKLYFKYFVKLFAPHGGLLCVYVVLKYICLIFNVLFSPMNLIFGCTELRIASIVYFFDVVVCLFSVLWTDNLWHVIKLNVFISLFVYSLMVAPLPVFHCFFATFYSLGCSSHCNYGLISRPSPAKSEQNQQFSEVKRFRKDKYIITIFFCLQIGHWMNYKKMPIVKFCFTYHFFVIYLYFSLKDVHSQKNVLIILFLTTLLKFSLELPKL